MAEVEFKVEGRVAHVLLNRPDDLNAITPAMDLALADCWARINDDGEIWCATISAAGSRAFSIGSDTTGTHSPRQIAFGGGLTGVGGPLITLRKPLVAAVQGFCVGGGFELAMCADIIVATDDASFGLPETKVGIIGECGVVHRAVRQLPYRIAMAMILTGQRIGASDAQRFGLVNVVVPPGEIWAETLRWTDKINAASPLANQAAKAAANAGLRLPLDAALGSRFAEIERYADTEDSSESYSARVEQRKPTWLGR